MFDRTYLPPADLEFVVMTDTHYMLDPGGGQVEFESRRRQAARAEQALRQVASLDPAFVVHLGDLVQEFPESAGFAESVAQALAQMAEAGVRPRQVAGNHDVGDKPDPTMPTDWVTVESLQGYHDRFGSSWYSWMQEGCHFVVLNSQIMNGPLPEAAAQQRWLEQDLDAHAGVPTFIFLHLAPFLVWEEEQGLGHYDNIDEPARSWLLGQIRAHNVQMIFAGHSHFAFFNRIGEARSYVVPSTSFTRPGFCEVFASAPPPERGRDDVAKLGFFLVRVRDGHASVHLIRTDGATTSPAGDAAERRLVTRVSRDLPASPLGVTLRHPLAPATEVPIAWQSTIRQPVRNDFPLLACVELGVRYVRVPAADLADPRQRDRLAALRDEGVAITAMWIWSERSRLVEEAERHRELLAGVEIQLPSALEPAEACRRAIARVSAIVPVTLAPLLPREIVPGKQHARTRIGYYPEELAALERALGDAGVERVLCRVAAGQDPGRAIEALRQQPAPRSIRAVDWAVEFADADPVQQTPRAVAALAAVATRPGSRLYLEPLVDLDRTMDTPPGLLDRLCNPRSVFHAVRTLNTILFSDAAPWQPAGASPGANGAAALTLSRGGERVTIVLPDPAGAAEHPSSPAAAVGDGDRVAIHLETATSRRLSGAGDEVRPGATVIRHSGVGAVTAARLTEGGELP